MNTYVKYCPNVFVAQCDEKQVKGNVIEMTTKYGKIHDVEVHNYLGQTREGKHLHSITRCDGTNHQTRMQARANKRQYSAELAEKKSNHYYEASKEGKDFLSLAEPIKIGHHSEKRHRALIERNHERMRKSIEFDKKSDEMQSKADYWKSRAEEINLSMPESLEYFEFLLEEAKLKHESLLNGTLKREHSFSLTYAKKEVNEFQKKLDLAKKMWG